MQAPGRIWNKRAFSPLYLPKKVRICISNSAKLRKSVCLRKVHFFALSFSQNYCPNLLKNKLIQNLKFPNNFCSKRWGGWFSGKPSTSINIYPALWQNKAKWNVELLLCNFHVFFQRFIWCVLCFRAECGSADNLCMFELNAWHIPACMGVGFAVGSVLKIVNVNTQMQVWL